MRVNMPVTNVEVQLRPGDMIVSKTDLKGIITYVNEDFIRISGFTEKELLGQPHNIVRHPDMPEEAFADLWSSLKAGRPWTGYVKNRCKNGDYYWVLANATPIRENGQITGYMSVRTAPSRAEIAEVERLYRLFREGKQGNLVIRDGKVVKGGWREKLNPTPRHPEGPHAHPAGSRRGAPDGGRRHGAARTGALLRQSQNRL
ncbi:MAG: PAS domain-containing protein [Burkholderiales bacterium]